MLMARTWSDYHNSTTLHTQFGCKEISGTGKEKMKKLLQKFRVRLKNLKNSD